MHFQRHFSNFLLLLLFPFLPLAQEIEGTFRHYSTEDGLSYDGVLCMEQDREGFMWFGTWDGLNRFDGNNFVTYKARPGDNSILKNNKIKDIQEDKAGYLWVTTYDSKAYRFDKKAESFWAINKASSGESLESARVEKVQITEEGDVWLITEDQGLICAVYNKEFRDVNVYTFSTKNGLLPSDRVSFLLDDGQGKIWVGTDNGLTALAKSGSSYRQAIRFANGNSVFGNFPFSCAASSQGKLYFGAGNGRMFIYENQSFKISKLDKKVNIHAIKATKAGRIYLSTDAGLYEYDLLKRQTQHIPSSAKANLRSIYEDKKGNLWIEPAYEGIIHYSPQEQYFQHFRHKREKQLPEVFDAQPSRDKSYQVLEDSNGMLWANLKGGGFGYYNEQENAISYLDVAPGASGQKLSNDVECFYVDPNGVLWLSTRLGGVHKFILGKKNFEHFTLKPLSGNRFENEVRAVFEDSKQRLWLSTKIGETYLFDRSGKALALPVSNMRSDQFGSVYTIKETKSGLIFLGTKGQGLVVLTPQDKQRNSYVAKRYKYSRTDPNSITADMIYAILEDGNGRIWIGTFGGGINEAIFTPGGLTFRNNRNFYKNYPIRTTNVIRNLAEDDAGIIWIATTNGILRFDPRQNQDAKFYSTQKIPGDRNSLGNNDVLCVYSDQHKQLWVGTFGGGLNRVIGRPNLKDALKFEVFTKDQGLPNDIILSLINDEQGNLWMATENGLSRLNAKEKTFRNFDSVDGLPKSGFSESSSALSSSGDLIFGGVEGFVRFDPSKIKGEKRAVNIALTNLQLYNNDVSVGHEDSPLRQAINHTRVLKLKHDQNVLNIDYAVLDFRTSHNFSYAYILEGFDKNWHYVKNQKRASYTKLPPGHYVFRVKSLNPDLFSNVPEKSLEIIIMPPWYRTFWAYLFYGILIIAAVWIARNIIITMIKLRNKVILEHKLTEMKLSFFTNISHELRTPLTLIVNPLRQIEKSETLTAKGKEYMAVVNKNANRMVRFINQLLDFRKIQTGNIQLKITEIELVSFVKNIAAYFNDIIEEKQIRLNVRSNQEMCRTWVDEEKMDIVFYNLLSNACKFTPKGKKIEIELECSAEEVTVRIIDEGIGVPEGQLDDIFKLYFEGEHSPAQKGTGIGLALSREIVKEHQGDISAANNPDAGMRFEVKLKRGNNHFTESELSHEQKAESSTAQTEFETAEARPLAGTDKREDEEHDRKSKPLVLLVEDNTDLRNFLADQLTEVFQVLQAEDGQIGLALAEKHLPDLILSDVMMPNMDGMELLEKLKTQMETSHIPVILLTAKSSVENQISGLKHGADLYLTKPFHTEHVLTAVDNLIKQRKSLYEKFTDQQKIMKLEPGEISITSKDEEFLKQVISIVEEGMADPKFNIDAVASAVGLGRTTFFKKLKSLTNMSPVEFVRDIRLKRGKQVMDAGQHSVSEIAYMIGFSSAGYFSTCFKEAYGSSPSEYLKAKG